MLNSKVNYLEDIFEKKSMNHKTDRYFCMTSWGCQKKVQCIPFLYINSRLKVFTDIKTLVAGTYRCLV